MPGGGADRYYVVVPLGFYQSIKEDLVSWGYRKDLGYFYFSDRMQRIIMRICTEISFLEDIRI